MTTRTWHHRKLDVWRTSMDLATAIYSLTKQLPGSERFGLVTQMRRAVVSVPSNIAEGAARGSSAEFSRFLMIARGSIAELETQLELVQRLDLTSVDPSIGEKLQSIRQMLTGLIRKVANKS